ncbi:ABC transporter permease [Actinomadura barringtoniae]|nr:ABC transporter permease [Actinomadura barringtoniae]
MHFFRDTYLIFKRQMMLALRNPALIATTLLQPVLFLAFFGPLFTRVYDKGVLEVPGSNAYAFFVPGLLVQLGLFGAAFVGFTIIADWRAGVVERMRVTPASRLSILLGRVLRDVVILVTQSIVLVLAGLLFGMRAPVGGILLALAFIAALATALASFSYTLGLLTKSEDAFAPILNSLMMPMLLLSGIMLPMQIGPSWLNWISRFTPFRYIIDAIRDGFRGDYTSSAMAEGGAVAIGLAAVCVAVGVRTFLRENA